MNTELMQYLPPIGEAQAGGAEKYYGAVAEGYDAKRENSPKWAIEQRIVEDMLSDLPKGNWVLDCPVGTGRFLPFYAKQGLLVKAVDRSPDMLQQASLKGEFSNVRFFTGDVRHLDALHDKSVDASVMCRLTRWLSPEDCVQAYRELMRVTRKKIVITARVRNHPHARGYDLIDAALSGGWRIERDEAGYEEDYRIIMLATDSGVA